MPGRKAPEADRKEQILNAALRTAARDGLEGLTIRNVAAEAELSSGLVLFHFNTKDALLTAALDVLLETTAVLRIDDEVARIPPSLDRLLALLRREMERLARDPWRIRLFFEYWVLGTRHPVIRQRIRAQLARYRRAFLPLAKGVIAAEPARFAEVTAEGLATVSVGLIKGCAFQAVIDPKHFDIDQFVSATEALMEHLRSPLPAAG
jgi:AcrR family transcriptional regulator